MKTSQRFTLIAAAFAIIATSSTFADTSAAPSLVVKSTGLDLKTDQGMREMYARTYGISTTVSNCSNNYGPYQFPEKLIPLMILNLLEGKPLPVYGKGENVRDWLYVDDHAEAIWFIVQNGKRGETYNVGGEAEWANIALVHKLIEVVAEATDKDASELKKQIAFVADRPGHDARYAIDCSKLKRELGWAQRHDLETGLRATVDWYLANPSWVERVKSGAYRDWLAQNYGGRG